MADSGSGGGVTGEMNSDSVISITSESSDTVTTAVDQSRSESGNQQEVSSVQSDGSSEMKSSLPSVNHKDGNVVEEMSVDSGIATPSERSGTLTPGDEPRSESGQSESVFSYRQQVSSVGSGGKSRDSALMDITVKTVDNKEKTFSLCPDSTVQDLYTKVANWLDRCVDQTHLLYQSEKLTMDDTNTKTKKTLR